MNLTSAGVAPTFDKSRACSAPTVRLSCPGAPGWTIAGLPLTLAVRQAVPQAATRRSAERLREVLVIIRRPMTVGLLENPTVPTGSRRISPGGRLAGNALAGVPPPPCRRRGLGAAPPPPRAAPPGGGFPAPPPRGPPPPPAPP